MIAATTYEDNGDARGRAASGDTTDDHHNGKFAEGKGNVIVSVRVRPDAEGTPKGKADGEWMVDGRRSLVAYKGREGGDYFYGNQPSINHHGSDITDTNQIMFLLPTTTTQRFTTPLRSDSFGESWRATMEQCLRME